MRTYLQQEPPHVGRSKRLQSSEFLEPGRLLQAKGIMIASIFILAGDAFTSFFNNKKHSKKTPSLLKFGYFLALFVFIVWCIHIYLMPQIPFIEKYLYDNEASSVREASSKLLDVPTWFIYMAQWFMFF